MSASSNPRQSKRHRDALMFVLTVFLLLGLQPAKAEAIAGTEAAEFLVDRDCFKRKPPGAEHSKPCLNQQAVVAQAALLALSNGETQTDDFGLMRFSYQDVPFACLRSGQEVRCLVLDAVQ